MKFIIDTHCHSVASGHAYSTIKENFVQASKIGFKAIAITDHPETLPGGANELYFRNLAVLPDYIENVKLYRGIELNITDEDGTVDYDNEFLKRLNIVGAGLHTPCIKPKSKKENTNCYTNAMKKTNIDVITHPTDPRYEIDVEEFCICASGTNTAIEINNNALMTKSLRFSEKNFYDLINMAHKHNTYITCGSDAHFYTAVGGFENIYNFLQNQKVNENLFLCTSVQKLDDFLKKGRNNG